jgi:hypothetical protein
MKKFYLLVEKQWQDPGNRNCSPGCEYQFSSSPDVSWDNQGNAAVMKRLGEYMDQAKTLAQTADQKRRIALFDEAVWRFMLAGQREYRVKQPYPLRIFNGIEHVPGKFGNAYKFTFSMLGIRDPQFSDAAGTFECWVLGGTNGNSGGNLFTAATRGHTSGHSMGWEKGLWTYMTWDGAVTNRVQARGKLPDGWHHLMATWNAAAGRLALYVDGKEAASARYAKTRAAGVPVVAIGGTANYMWGDMGIWSWGPIDEVRLSDIARKPVPGGQTAPHTPDAHTLALLHFDESGDDTPVWGGGKAGAKGDPFVCGNEAK